MVMDREGYMFNGEGLEEGIYFMVKEYKDGYVQWGRIGRRYIFHG